VRGVAGEHVKSAAHYKLKRRRVKRRPAESSTAAKSRLRPLSRSNSWKVAAVPTSRGGPAARVPNYRAVRLLVRSAEMPGVGTRKARALARGHPLLRFM
jgi:hypothetical protein